MIKKKKMAEVMDELDESPMEEFMEKKMMDKKMDVFDFKKDPMDFIFDKKMDKDMDDFMEKKIVDEKLEEIMEDIMDEKNIGFNGKGSAKELMKDKKVLKKMK